MLHLGDITKINGATVPITDCVIFGAPCQDISVAGLRKGMLHESKGDSETTRSGLFHEAIRIIKEMRERDEANGRSGEFIRPRYAVYENVPGAFSSNKAEDFRIVLEEIAKIADKDAVIPKPPKGKWTTSGCIVGDGWSIAWRVLDAQFWGLTHYLDNGNILKLGTPQRRRRIALVADFGGQSAQEILFVRKGLSGHPNEGREKRQGTTSDPKGSLGVYDREREQIAYTMQERAGCEGGGKGALAQTDRSSAIKTVNSQTLFQPIGCDVYNLAETGNKACSLTSGGYTSTGTCPKVMMPIAYRKQAHPRNSEEGQGWEETNLSDTLNVFDNTEARTPIVVVDNQPLTFDARGNGDGKVCATITGDHENRITDFTNVVVAFDRSAYNQGKNAQYDIGIDEKGIAHSLVAKGPGGVCYAVDMGGGKSSVDIHEDRSPTLTTTHYGEPAVCYSTNHGSFHTLADEEKVATLQATDYKDPPIVYQTVALEGNGQRPSHRGDGYAETDKSYTLNSTEVHGVAYMETVVRTRYIVRRLTPLECERLQGFPDGWTDIGEWVDSKGKVRQTSDAARYKALGNSICLPPWKWILKRLCAQYERDATMASLFDGIGGFPLIWEQLNGKGTCLWASEIDGFPMAVTKARIGE